MKKITFYSVLIILLSCISFFAFKTINRKDTKILVFSKTAGFRHASIEGGKLAIIKLGKENGFEVDTTENAEIFNEKNLKTYSAIVFLSTTGNILDIPQQRELERYIQAGGGFVGIHAATDTEYDWNWYVKMVGASFLSHPKQQDAVINVINRKHISTSFLPKKWKRFDEWYSFKNINKEVTVLAKLDESTYAGGMNGKDHPIAWYHNYDGGRAWYTGCGHTNESYTEDLFLKHVLGGIKYAIGNNLELDYSKSYSMKVPEENRFNNKLLASGLDEPMELAVANDGKVFFVERKGNVKLYNPQNNKIEIIAQIPVSLKYNNGNNSEDGLLGISLDPKFDTNHWVYLFYSPAGKISEQHVSRFTYENEKLNLLSEKILIKIPTQRDECCHSGGCLQFDNKGNLFISIGDNTNPFNTAYAPIDTRQGRSAWDSQKSSSNMNDFRGKILRIHPETDGSYTIPEGNLFPKDGSKGKSEIYVMGCRNPYRVAWDGKRKFLYWGDVGPDAGKDSSRGPRGYDEINQARSAGYYGWPYFIANNKPYEIVDFSDNKYLGKLDVNKPVNNSPNNSGLKELPPARPAFIYYPYTESAEFPEVGKGGRTSMAGETYYYDDYKSDSEIKFPKYYDGKLFIYDWARGWIMAVTLKENGDYDHMEPFMPHTVFSNPTDMQFGNDGSLYVLEYGYTWFGKDPNAKLIKITYEAGNRSPIAKIEVDQTIGKEPFTVHFSSKGSCDPDGDELKYAWKFDENSVQSTEANPPFTFKKAGIYHTNLTITDTKGKVNSTEIEVKIGNTSPSVDIVTNSNKTFYWDNQIINYQIVVKDKDENEIDEKKVKVTLDYLAAGQDNVEIEAGHKESKVDNSNEVIDINNALLLSSDCKICHKVQGESVGPALALVADKYKKDPKAINFLSAKIINGGGGVWGDREMAAHPQINKKDAMTMVKYILTLGEKSEVKKSLPLKGSFTANQQIGKSDEGRYFLTSSYTDKGDPVVGKLTTINKLILRNSKIQAENFDEKLNITKILKENGDLMGNLGNNSFLAFNKIDLKNISQIVFHLSSKNEYGTIEVHSSKQNGNLIGKIEYNPTGDLNKFEDLVLNINDIDQVQDLFFVFVKNEKTKNDIINCNLDWIQFKMTDKK